MIDFADLGVPGGHQHRSRPSRQRGIHIDADVADHEALVRSDAQFAVTAETPPAFIYVTDADTLVPPENSIAYYLALHRQHVPAELHVFRTGKHGSGLGQHEPLLSIWPELLARWMAGLGYMEQG